jgi:hypothetical protein
MKSRDIALPVSNIVATSGVEGQCLVWRFAADSYYRHLLQG